MQDRQKAAKVQITLARWLNSAWLQGLGREQKILVQQH